MYNGRRGYDTEANCWLTDSQAEMAADNPGCYPWVEWR
jgi:hypothetical protein